MKRSRAREDLYVSKLVLRPEPEVLKIGLYRVLRRVVERFEDLSYLSSGPEMHPEAGHSTASGQADHARTHTHTQMSKKRKHQHVIPAARKG